MSEMANKSQDSASASALQNTDENSKITCHLVSLPKIILTRIDEGKAPFTSVVLGKAKKAVKRLGGKKSTLSPATTETPRNKAPSNNLGISSRGRVRKGQNFALKTSKNQKKIIINKLDILKKSPVKSSPKEIKKAQNSPVKTMLKKTMLQKKSKIAIPSAKKSKPVPPKAPTPKPLKENKKVLPKPQPKKKVTPNIKVEHAVTKPVNTDSSEDEFLYEELIEELENTPNKLPGKKTQVEKTTNITLKPNVGNKPPTVVKGGIIKKVNLPPDLKTIASPSEFANSKEMTNGLNNLNENPKSSLSKNITPPTIPSVSPSPPKKPSPWPVSISSASKGPPEPTIRKRGRKKGVSIPKKPFKSPNTVRSQQKTPIIESRSVLSSTQLTPNINGFEEKTVSLANNKHKIGPKKTAKVVPLSKTQMLDDNMSDEYTEEETLENIDSDPIDIILKAVDDQMKNDTKDIVRNPSPLLKSIPSTYGSAKDDEDPHLDLLRILTDDSDEQIPSQSFESKENSQNTNKNNPSNESVRDSELTNDSSSIDSMNVLQNVDNSIESETEPSPRTIYDLMNEISLQYPSWNLHIIPETSAFCIAQVTKGRLGLPTLKKCIELDPVDYNAKVYIHQYHIKRFDGVYDSEESIIALIEEINSIKA